jgi:hypothetical protein
MIAMVHSAARVVFVKMENNAERHPAQSKKGFSAGIEQKNDD